MRSHTVQSPSPRQTDMLRLISVILMWSALASAGSSGTVEILRSPSKVKWFRPEPRDSPTVLSSPPPSTNDTSETPLAENTTLPPAAGNETETCERVDYEDWAAAVYHPPAEIPFIVFNSSFESPFAALLEPELIAGLAPLNRTSVNCTDFADDMPLRALSPGALASLSGR